MARTWGFPHRELTFKYDYMGRRVQKRVVDVTQGLELSSRRYLYDGWNLIAEYTAPGGTSLGTLVRSYTWGLDIVDSLADSAGVAALVQIADHSTGKAYFPSYDGNGNLAALFDGASASGGTCVAAYEYSPYGEFLRCEGTYAKENPFRFSTKFTDDETGLVYYGRRFYDPRNGRFLGRDPIDEKGGLNLYGFVGNDPVNKWDYLGMESEEEKRKRESIEQIVERARNEWDRTNNPMNAFVASAPRWTNQDEASYQAFMGAGNVGALGAPLTSEPTPIFYGGATNNDPNKTECAGLAKNLAQAQSIRASNARSFGAAGQYSPVLGDLTDAELNYLGNPSGSLVSDSSFSPIDNVNLTLTVTGAGAGYWAYQAGRVPTQTTIPGPYGMTGYSNVVGRANVIGGASLGLGIAGVTVGGIATVNSFATGDTAGGISNLAGTALSGLALVPGPIGIAAGTGSAVVNGSIAVLQAGVDARAHVNSVARARDAIKTMQLADQRIDAIKAEMTAKGCP